MQKLIIFAKAPRPGEVKTRLAAVYGPVKACEIYRQLLDRVIESVRSLKNVELHYAPADGAGEMQQFLQPGWTLHPQAEGDLGHKLVHAFQGAFSAGAQRVVIIGADCPHLTEKDIRDTWKELASHDVVLGPATDGGYWLIGLKNPQPELFSDIPWSTDQVLAHTLKRAKELTLRIQLLRILSDIDTAEDWKEFERITSTTIPKK